MYSYVGFGCAKLSLYPIYNFDYKKSSFLVIWIFSSVSELRDAKVYKNVQNSNSEN